MKRTLAQRSSLIAAVVLGAAPLIYAILGLRGVDDSRIFWMAAIATLFMAGLLSAAIGRRRGRRAVLLQAVLTFGVSTGVAMLTSVMMGASDSTALTLSAAFGISLALATVLVAWARPTPK